MKFVRRQSGFTLIELLVVISILAIIASLAIPAIKNLGKSNISVSAARQLLDDVGRARLLAISQRTTVYMVFVPTNYWATPLMPASTWTNNLNPIEFAAAVNLNDKQLTGYTFISYGAVGDQPGNHQWHYLAPWQNLPANSFIASWKFLPRNPSVYTSLGISPQYPNGQFPVYGFYYTNTIPFPTVSNTVASAVPPPFLPYIAFNYLGQLTVDGVNPSYQDEYIPLAQGIAGYGIDPATKNPVLSPVAINAIAETPSGNSTNSMFNLVHIDALTGRSRLEFQQVQ